MTEDSDAAIWQRVMSGDARQFGVVWDRHRDRVFRHLKARGASSHDAEDLAAVVFLECWRHRSNIRFVDESALPWLIVTATNVFRNYQRSQRRYRAFLDALPRPASDPDPADRIAELLDPELVQLRISLAQARPADARLLAMTAVEGFTVGEAAAVLGLSESAARMRLSRLRSNLRGTLGRAPHPERDTS